MTTDKINPTAAQGFEKAATIYDQARPSYPIEAIDYIKSLSNKLNIIIDLGAGTGKLTRLLGSLNAEQIIAVEPVSNMRENLKKIPFITKVIDGTAEQIPFEDSTIDMILCGQSFHWFSTHSALQEIHRVLKPNGFLVIIANLAGNQNDQWAEKLSDYVDSFQSKDTPRYKTMEWKKVFDNQDLFSALEHRQFPYKHRATRDICVNRILSISFIAMLPSEEKEKLISEVHKMLDNIEEIRNLEEFDLNYLTDVYWCSALKPLP